MYSLVVDSERTEFHEGVELLLVYFAPFPATWSLNLFPTSFVEPV